MSTDVQGLYGRKFELVWLETKLFPVNMVTGVPPIVLLHGAPGSGRSTLARALVAQHMGGGNERAPLIVFSGRQPPRNQLLAEYVSGLVRESQTTVTGLQAFAQEVARGFSSAWASLSSEAKGPVEAYNVDGSPRNTPVVEAPVETPPEGQLLAQAFVHNYERSLEVVDDATAHQLRRLRSLFLFDDFDEYPPALKEWIGDTLLGEIGRSNELPPSSFLLTGKESWEAGGQADYWRAHPAAFAQKEIGPIGRSSCMEWLEQAGQAPELVDALLEHTEGLPGRIARLLQQPKELDKRLAEASDLHGWMAPLDPRQRRWLHAAAMAERLSEESLQVLLGQREASEAFAWLSSDCPVDAVRCVNIDGVRQILLGASLRERVLSLSVAKVPRRHREFLERMELQTKVTTKVPAAYARERLRQLAPMQPFSFAMLKEAFPEEQHNG